MGTKKTWISAATTSVLYRCSPGANVELGGVFSQFLAQAFHYTVYWHTLKKTARLVPSPWSSTKEPPTQAPGEMERAVCQALPKECIRSSLPRGRAGRDEGQWDLAFLCPGEMSCSVGCRKGRGNVPSHLVLLHCDCCQHQQPVVVMPSSSVNRAGACSLARGQGWARHLSLVFEMLFVLFVTDGSRTSNPGGGKWPLSLLATYPSSMSRT